MNADPDSVVLPPRTTIPAAAFVLPGIIPACTVLCPYVPPGVASVLSLFIVPVLEFIVGNSPPSLGRQTPPLPPHRRIPALRDTPVFHAALLARVFLSVAAFVRGVVYAGGDTGNVNCLVVAIDLGCISTTLSSACHELLHGVGKAGTPVDRLIAWTVASIALFPSFHADHLLHHKYIGTNEDSASAKRGKSVYEHIVRMEIVSLRHSLGLSATGNTKAIWRPSPAVRSSFLRGLAFSLFLVALVRVCLGPRALAVYVGGAVLGVALLDSGNYVEHYGLRRKVVSDEDATVFETVKVKHSWDCSNVLSNVMYFELGRHSDHHVSGSKPYPLLDFTGNAPEYPYGLVTMSLLAFTPSVFKSIAHPALDNMAKRQ